MIANPNVERETKKVLNVVARVLNVFGGDVAPVPPPVFVVDPGLEDDLGRGHFGSAAAVSQQEPLTTDGGPADVDVEGDGGDQFTNDVVDRLITSGSWTWADGGVGKRP